jgi:hybrid cluster-associated redox disulfide protein
MRNKEVKTMANQVTPDMVIGDVLAMDRGTASIFFNNGLHCIGCPSSSGESLEDACEVHGLDCDDLIQELNEYLAGK